MVRFLTLEALLNCATEHLSLPAEELLYSFVTLRLIKRPHNQQQPVLQPCRVIIISWLRILVNDPNLVKNVVSTPCLRGKVSNYSLLGSLTCRLINYNSQINNYLTLYLWGAGSRCGLCCQHVRGNLKEPGYTRRVLSLRQLFCLKSRLANSSMKFRSRTRAAVTHWLITNSQLVWHLRCQTNW